MAIADRAPEVAGRFYPASATQLTQSLAACFAEAEAAVEPAPDQVAALVAPHAGYPYSGPTAAHAYQRVRGKRPERVILLGRSHYHAFEGGIIDRHSAWQTPLGRAPLDEAFIETHLQRPGLLRGSEAHFEEHTLEVQLPFIQQVLGDAPIVPILFGCNPDAWHMALGEYLASVLSQEDLVIASTDMSHFHPQEEAERLDRASLDILMRQDMQELCAAAPAGACSMCGATAVVVAMAYALKRQATQWQLLDYRTSGARSGIYDRVVGYAAVSMERAA